MEPLTFKIITDADDAGVRRYEKALGGVDVTSRKTSSAIKGFVGDLQNAQNASDITSSALNALTKILGTSLAATGAVVVGKLLVDAFNKVNEAVKESTKSVEAANKEISKIALAGPSFETANRSAEILNKTAEELRKKIEEINQSKLQSFIAGITGAKDEMEKLAATTTKQAQEAQKQAIVQGLLDLERVKNANAYVKAAQEAAAPYQKLIELARQLGDQQLINTLISKQAASAAQAELEIKTKEQLASTEATKKAEEEKIKAIQKLEEEAAKQSQKILDAETKAREEAYKIEANFSAQLLQKESERKDKIDEQIKSIQQRKKEIEDEIQLILQTGAIQAAGAGGTSRGQGQAPSSFQVGLEEKLLRERYEAIKQRDSEYFDFVKERLKEQGKDYSNWAVQNEIARIATAAQSAEITSQTGKLKKLQEAHEGLSQETRDLIRESIKLAETLTSNSKSVDGATISFSDFTKDFTTSGDDVNMTMKFLSESGDAFGKTADMAGYELDIFKVSTEMAKTSLEGLANTINTINAAVAPGGGETALATEGTLSAVLNELKLTLFELKSYAHAT